VKGEEEEGEEEEGEEEEGEGDITIVYMTGDKTP
jgi:hypothetical protein